MNSALTFLNRTYLNVEAVIQIVFMELGIFIGMVTFVGSVAACYKLDGKLKTPHFGGFATLNAILMIISIVLMVLGGITAFFDEDVRAYFPPAWNLSLGWLFNIALVIVAMIYGLCFVLPIGGADMPVVISVLNAFSGISGCTAGFMLQDNLLIITGAIVASSGVILSYIMCLSMNRSLMSVLAGGFGEGSSKAPAKKEGKSEPERLPRS